MKPGSSFPELLITHERPMPIDKSEDRIQQMFGAIADRYDFLNHLLSLGIDRYWRRQTVRRAAPNGSGPILDLCTGTGDLAFAFLRRAGPATLVVGADFCHPMLVIAEKKRQRMQNDPAVVRTAGPIFLEADAQQLPFADNSFQIVSVAFGLRNVTDTDRGLREIARVCRPQGRVAVLEFSTPAWQPWKAVYGWYFRHVLPRIGQALARNRHGAYNYLPASVGEFPSGEALAARMRAAGLHEVNYWPLTLGVATLYVGVK